MTGEKPAQAMPAKRQIRVGVAGISTSGKSTLVSALKGEIKCGVVAGDSFYIRDGSSPKVVVMGQQTPNWDDPSSINWKKFYSAITSNQDEVVLIDSFQLFYSSDITSTLDAAIILEFTQEEFPIALDRRIIRVAHQHTPDNYRLTPTASEAHFEACYYEDIVWKMAYEKREYWDLPGWQKPVLHLSATAPILSNVEKAKEFIRELMDIMKIEEKEE